MTSKLIASELAIDQWQVEKTIKLLEEGATTPFISRYRKEMTGSLDEVAIGKIRLLMERYQELEKRKETILKAIEDQGKLNQELKDRILNTFDSATLEDLYLPFKQKRKTKAEIARKAGLEPLAKILMAQRDPNPLARIDSFVKGDITSTSEAIEGARHIISEWVNENQKARDIVRRLFTQQALISSKVIKSKVEEAEKFRDYFNYQERLSKCRSHRFLALKRGEREGFLRVSIRPPEEYALERLNRFFIKNDVSGNIEMAIKDAYKRLLAPAIENEVTAESKHKADEEAIKVFAENLKQLLLGAPLGEKRILAIDPGFKSGCKVVCLDEKGDLLHNENIYPHPPQGQTQMAMRKISTLTEQYAIDAIAIGNGTAGRETENLIKRMRFKKDVQVFMVNEAGASVYSASSVAREEFPNYDVTVRGAVSIGRRLMDPLAELVKIDPKSIGVGQYQHDVDQKVLQRSLDDVVGSCVNSIGVDLNTASKHLLNYVSGLGPQLAQNIVDYRKETGSFASRSDLLKVPRMGPRAYEQSAGFLRIKNGMNPLDNSAVHPERYEIVNRIGKKAGLAVGQLIGDKEAISNIRFEEFVDAELGMETLNDIKQELLRPGLDPRRKAKVFEFAKGIRNIEDLKVGMVLPGIITNITNFGAFVDVGVKQDGLVHISNIANEFISDPSDHVRLNQHVSVKVIEVDAPRKRIGLSMKD